MDKKQIRIIKSEYLISAVDVKKSQIDERSEIAFIGRSNVGKSSLINSLCNHKGLALVSKSPGKTRTINYFDIRSRQDKIDGAESVFEDQEWYLVDLPGYGFAKTSHSNRDAWAKFIANYVKNSQNLKLLCLLIDLRHPGLEIDNNAYNWLNSLGVPLQIIGTKSDKLNNSDRQKNLNQLARFYPSENPPLAYSSLKHTGRSNLLRIIEDIICTERSFT